MENKESKRLEEFLNINEDQILEIVDEYRINPNPKSRKHYPEDFKIIKSKITSLYLYLRTTNETTTESIIDNTNISSNTQVKLIKDIGYKINIFNKEYYKTLVTPKQGGKTELKTFIRPILNPEYKFKFKSKIPKPKLTEEDALNKFTVYGDRNGFIEIYKKLKSEANSESKLNILNAKVKKMKAKEWLYDGKSYTIDQNHYNLFCHINTEFLPLIKVNRGKPVIFLDIIASKPSFLYYHILKDNEELAEEYKQLLLGKGFYHNITELIINNNEYLDVIDNSFKKVINFEDKVKWIKKKFMPTFFDENSFKTIGDELVRVYPLAKILEKEFPGLNKYYSKQLPKSLDKMQALFINKFADILLNDNIPNIRRVDEVVVPKSDLDKVLNYLNEFIEDNFDKTIIKYSLECVENGKLVEFTFEDTITESKIVSNTNTLDVIEEVQTETETIDTDEIEDMEDKLSKFEYYKILDEQIIKWFGKFRRNRQFLLVKEDIYKSCYEDYLNGIKFNKETLANKINEIIK